VLSERDVVEVLERKGPLAARGIVAALRSKHPEITRRDVNSILYRGSGSTFERSDDERPLWSLVAARAADVEPTPPPQVTRRPAAASEGPRARVPAAVRKEQHDG